MTDATNPVVIGEEENQCIGGGMKRAAEQDVIELENEQPDRSPKRPRLEPGETPENKAEVVSVAPLVPYGYSAVEKEDEEKKKEQKHAEDDEKEKLGVEEEKEKQAPEENKGEGTSAQSLVANGPIAGDAVLSSLPVSTQ